MGGDLLGVANIPRVRPQVRPAAIVTGKSALSTIAFQHANPERSRDPKGKRALGSRVIGLDNLFGRYLLPH